MPNANLDIQKKSILISWKEHDVLLKHSKAWMDLHWKEYRKKWFLGGVQLTAKGYQIENLQEQLEQSKAQDPLFHATKPPFKFI